MKIRQQSMSLRTIYSSLFLIGCFFLPFNDFEGLKYLGEFKNEAGSYFFFAGFLLLLIESFVRGTFNMPYKSYIFQLLVFFLFWCIVSILLNINSVHTNFFKHTSGIYRFVRQYVSLLLSSLLFFLFYWNVIRKIEIFRLLLIIRKVFLISLLFTFIYGFIETLIVVFHFSFLRYLLGVFDYFPFLDVNYPPGGRISSVCYESPALGNFLISIAGWMFSYILTEKSKARFLPLFMVLFLTFFSGSRTALINVGLQTIILIIILYSKIEYRRLINKIASYFLGFICIALLINAPKIIKEFNKKTESLNFVKNLKNNVSNQSRFGMQYASIQVFKENPVFGVGFGQEAYHKRKHYPRWATNKNYEFKLYYENQSFRSFPTAYNMYTRLLAELGIVGFSIWIYLIYLAIIKSNFIRKNGNETEKIFGFIFVISFVGLVMNWLQTDFFRQHLFWLCLAILIKIEQKMPSKTT